MSEGSDVQESDSSCVYDVNTVLCVSLSNQSIYYNEKVITSLSLFSPFSLFFLAFSFFAQPSLPQFPLDRPRGHYRSWTLGAALSLPGDARCRLQRITQREVVS